MSSSIRPLPLAVVLSAAAVLGYLGYRTFVAAPQSAPPAAELPDRSAAPLPDSLPAIVLQNLDQEPTAIDSWPDRPLLINFWATWCAPCLREIPLLKEFQAQYDEVRVVGIAVDRFDPVASFAADMTFNYPVLVGETQAIEAAAALGVGVLALPITVFTDRTGAVLGIHTGELHAEHLDNYRAVLADLAAGRADRAAARARIAGRM